MKRTVWKFQIEVTDCQTVMMPTGAELLTVQGQGGGDWTPDVCIWALVDPSAPQEPREVRVVGTGHPIEFLIRKYVGTFQLRGGALVFHVFEPEVA